MMIGWTIIIFMKLNKILRLLYLMNKYLSVVLCLLVVYATAIPKYYHKVVHKTDPDAKCLDGTPAFLYINEGGDTKNIMIYFLGGGMCGDSTLDSTL